MCGSKLYLHLSQSASDDLKSQWWGKNIENWRNSQQDWTYVEAVNKLEALKEACKSQYLKDTQNKQVAQGNYVYAKENQQADSLGPYRIIELKGSYVVICDAIKGLRTIHLNNCGLIKTNGDNRNSTDWWRHTTS